MAVESKKNQGVSFIAAQAKKELSAITGLTASTVLGMEHEEDKWRVTIEMVEKKSIPDSMDILGTYEVNLNDEGQLLTFSRISLRKRGDTTE